MVSFGSSNAFAGRTVTHQHHCPSYVNDQDLCINYEEFPAEVKIGEPYSFILVFYTWDSSYSNERVYKDLEGTFDLSLGMGHHGHGSAPVKVTKIGTGRYRVEDAVFVMDGMWSIDLMIKQPGHAPYTARSLFAYIYKD